MASFEASLSAQGLGTALGHRALSRLLRVLGVAWLGCAPAGFAADAEWRTINVLGVFSFAAPKDLKQQKVQPIDSLAGSYRSPSMTLDYDHGWYSDSLEGPYPSTKDLVRKQVTINGRRGELVQMRHEDHPFPYVVAVHFPDLNGVLSVAGEGPTVRGEPEVSLTFWITCKTKRDAEYAKLIVGSINVASTK